LSLETCLEKGEELSGAAEGAPLAGGDVLREAVKPEALGVVHPVGVQIRITNISTRVIVRADSKGVLKACRWLRTRRSESRYTFPMLILAALAAAISLLAASSASGETPRVITERDSGKTFHVSRGHERTVRLSNRYVWTEPRVIGNAVRLLQVNYFVDPGFQEWTIHARARGTVRISAVGSGGTSRLFRIRVIVP
jgi:hypothetical protein